MNDDVRQKELDTEAQFFQSPWSDATEKIRDRTLVVSLIGILMAAARIFPRQFNTFGLNATDINPRALLIAWAAVDGYLTITLAFHAYSDFVRSYWIRLTRVTFTTPRVIQGRTPEEVAFSRRRMERRSRNTNTDS